MSVEKYIQAKEEYCKTFAVNGLHITTALIDMDGVLYDSMKYHATAWHRMISELGIDCTRDEFFLYEGMTGIATINLIFKRAYGREVSEAEARELYDRKARYFIEMGKKEIMPGAQTMIKTLMNNNIRRVLVTGSGQNSLLSRIDDDYAGAFSCIDRVTAADVKYGKPHPEPYLMGLKKAEALPQQAIVIENAPLGVEAGKAAGCFTIGITTGPIPEKELYKAGADIVFPSMNCFAEELQLLLDTLNARI